MALVAASKLRPELALVVSPTETVAIERTDPGNFVWPIPNAPELTSTRLTLIIRSKPWCVGIGRENGGQREYGFWLFESIEIKTILNCELEKF